MTLTFYFDCIRHTISADYCTCFFILFISVVDIGIDISFTCVSI